MLVQTLAFTPIAYLVLVGVVEGISPSMEEAAQTLRADRWRTFSTVTWPLMRPGLANAFLIGFVESLADFGNPLVLGGNFDVLSTDIFFAIVGSQNDPGRAAALSIVLLVLTLVRLRPRSARGSAEALLHDRSPARAIPGSRRALPRRRAAGWSMARRCRGSPSPSSSTA